MAIATNILTINAPNQRGRIHWAVNATSADATGNEIVIAAPTTPASLYLKKIVINCVAAITVWLNDGTTTLLGAFNFAAGAPGVVSIEFAFPIKWGAAKPLDMDASGAGAIQIYVEGFTA